MKTRRPLIDISRNTLHGQSKGCWLAIQIGFTLILFPCLCGNRNGQGLRVYLGAPEQYATGWHCTLWGINRMRFRLPKCLQLGQYS